MKTGLDLSGRGLSFVDKQKARGTVKPQKGRRAIGNLFRSYWPSPFRGLMSGTEGETGATPSPLTAGLTVRGYLG